VIPLSRSFKDTVKARAARDPAFRAALLAEGVEVSAAGEISLASMSEVRLENWRIVDMPRTDFYGAAHQVLVGRVNDHPRVPDGHRSLTTEIVEWAQDRSWARTFNTLYMLGTPMPDDEEFDDRIKAAIENRIREMNLPFTAVNIT
jgi:hypothetical protein